jgi:hypothetical protein
MLALVRKILTLAAFAAAFFMPSFAPATTIDAALVPDGTYVVKVEKVVDAQHLLVKMDNGVETTLVATGSVDFSKVKASDSIKISVINGKVPVYAIQ